MYIHISYIYIYTHPLDAARMRRLCLAPPDQTPPLRWLWIGAFPDYLNSAWWARASRRLDDKQWCCTACCNISCFTQQ